VVVTSDDIVEVFDDNNVTFMVELSPRGPK